MTEEQKKKCEEIYKLYELNYRNSGIIKNIAKFILISFRIMPVFYLNRYGSGWIKIAMLLAKVFNIDITKKRSKKICNRVFKSILHAHLKFSKVPALLIAFMPFLVFIPIFSKFSNLFEFDCMFWSIANYFDNANNDELTLNLLILGQTGVGKSSLLNALSGKKLFKTADDKEKEEKVKPTTPAGIFRQTVEIDGKKVNVYDSWGIERDDKSAKEWKELIKNELKKRGVDKDIKDWFHSVTFCISAGKNGIEYIERDIIKELLDAKYNVVIALSQADYMISNTKEENDKFIEMIKKESGANIVIPIAANPKKSMIMTEAPKPFGLPEYKAAILVSWKKIFIDRMPLHIIEKLKKDIENAKSNAPREGKDLEKLSKEIQEYFKDMLIKNTKKYIEESIKKYCSITGNMLNINQNIKIKNLDYDKRIVDFESEFADVYNDIIDFGDFVKNMHRIPIAAIKDLFGIIHFKIKGKKENIYKFICDLNKELINKISEKEFEDKIRKIIKDTLDNNMVKSIYYKILNFIIDIFNKIKKYIKKSN